MLAWLWNTLPTSHQAKVKSRTRWNVRADDLCGSFCNSRGQYKHIQRIRSASVPAGDGYHMAANTVRASGWYEVLICFF